MSDGRHVGVLGKNGKVNQKSDKGDKRESQYRNCMLGAVYAKEYLTPLRQNNYWVSSRLRLLCSYHQARMVLIDAVEIV